MTKPRMLDLFAGEGGASAGYMAAGWDVTAVDMDANRIGRNPADVLILADALEFLADHGHEFDAIHASPPCQGYSIATAGNLAAREKYQRLIAPTRELLQATGKAWVIENVEQAKADLLDPILLCGRQFGLAADDEDGQRVVLDRHRLFESNILLPVEPHRPHGNEQVAGVYGGSRRAPFKNGELKPAYLAVLDKFAARVERGGGYVPRSKRVKQELLGIDWMTVKGMEESIPPIFAAFIGQLLLVHVEGERAA